MADSWLERELKRQLMPVVAPETLWDRINQPVGDRHWVRRRLTAEPALWVTVAAIALLAFAGALRTFRADPAPEKLEERELAAFTGASRGFDFQPATLEAARKWVKSEANIDIRLPATAPRGDRGIAHLTGARLIQVRGLRVAAISYRVGDEEATLFVSARHTGLAGNMGGSRHLFSFSHAKSSSGVQFTSWNMGNETYTIVSPAAKSWQPACLLCHATTPG
ncbi:MAG TPA: hypothetical protein VHY84_00945 [Bryobacteraceae bacterium]|jgi:hypothetical protein|nr:hypothetical protein [Bryobacteraceae bacterium]